MKDKSISGGPWIARLLGAVLVVALFVYPLALDTPLLDPDEGFHAAIAQEMVERGDWIVPRTFGKPFWDKPAFYFWFEAASLKWFGMTEAAVRLPGLLFGLLGVLSTGLVGWRVLGTVKGSGPCFRLAPGAEGDALEPKNGPDPGIGQIAAGLYATMLFPLALCQAATPDVALVVWVNLALLCLWETERDAEALPSPRPAGRVPRPLPSASPRLRVSLLRVVALTLGAGLCMGLAMLTKGLFGVALIVVAQGGFLLWTRRLTAWSLLRGFAAVLLGAAVAALWYVPMERASPGYLHYFFIERHFLGLLSDTQTHGQRPLWYYLPLLLLGGLPWIGYLPALVPGGRGILSPILNRRKDSPPTNASPRLSSPFAFLLSWLICCTVLLSLAGSKLMTYLWPVFPPVAILAAEVWRRWLAGELSPEAAGRMRRTLQVSCLSGPLMFSILALVIAGEFEADLSTSAWMAILLAGFLPLGVLLVLRGGNLRRVLAAAIATTAAQFVLLMTFVVPDVAEPLNARELAEYFNRRGEVPRRVRLVDERVASLVFYLDPSLRRELRYDQIARLRSRHLPYEPPGTVLVVPDDTIAKARRQIDLHRLDYDLVGRHRVYEPLAGRPWLEELAGD